MGHNALTEKSINEMDVIPPGKLKCFISGKLRNNTPEERIRQDVARSLVEIYDYKREEMEMEFPIKMGRAKKKTDIVFSMVKNTRSRKCVYCCRS